MKLFVNGRFLTQQISGVQQFAYEICRELILCTDFTILVPAKSKLFSDEFDAKVLRIGKRNGHLWEQIDLMRYIHQQKDAILLNCCNTAPLLLKDQLVCIHDLAFEKDSSWFNPIFRKYYQLLIPGITRRSKQVFTVSETVKKELQEAYQLNPKKITVLGNKVSEKLLQADPIPLDLPQIGDKGYYLMVGTRNLRKNFNAVESLFEKELTDEFLIVVGGTHKAFGQSNQSTAGNILYLNFVKAGELKFLYQHAKGLINPSFYEGFGIPNIEAMAFQTPLICSDIPVFREVCKEIAQYFNPHQMAELKEIIQQSGKKDSGLNARINRGVEVFQQFQQQQRGSIILKAMTL